MGKGLRPPKQMGASLCTGCSKNSMDRNLEFWYRLCLRHGPSFVLRVHSESERSKFELQDVYQ